MEHKQYIFGDRLDFNSAEEFKKLRTNVLFSIPGDKKCTVIGLTSSMPSEGKTSTAINLAYTFAEAGKKTLLVECDLRLPTMAKKIGLPRTKGLSDILISDSNKISSIIQSTLSDNLHILTSGSIPPNPTELLGSERMVSVMDALKEGYDYIFLDLPPITVVADAVVVSKVLDGIVFVAREDYVSKKAFADSIRQLRFANAKILGIVTVCSKESNKGKYYKYKKDSSHYDYGYANKRRANMK